MFQQSLFLVEIEVQPVTSLYRSLLLRRKQNSCLCPRERERESVSESESESETEREGERERDRVSKRPWGRRLGLIAYYSHGVVGWV